MTNSEIVEKKYLFNITKINVPILLNYLIIHVFEKSLNQIYIYLDLDDLKCTQVSLYAGFHYCSQKDPEKRLQESENLLQKLTSKAYHY